MPITFSPPFPFSFPCPLLSIHLLSFPDTQGLSAGMLEYAYILLPTYKRMSLLLQASHLIRIVYILGFCATLSTRMVTLFISIPLVYLKVKIKMLT